MVLRFGTDGVRGPIDTFPISPAGFYLLGRALGRLHHHENQKQLQQTPSLLPSRVLVGCDTRGSSDMLVRSLQLGLAEAGLEALSLGILPSPAIARAAVASPQEVWLAAVVSASHNPFTDNGVKFFLNGRKLDRAREALLEAHFTEIVAEHGPLDDFRIMERARPDAGQNAQAMPAMLHVKNLPAEEAYCAALIESVGVSPRELSGTRLVVDCAHGAAFRVAPCLLRGLGAEVTEIGSEPDGMNINQGCGATAPEALSQAVRETGAHLGLAFDGDADRLVVVDSTGRKVTGEVLLARFAMNLGGSVVSTILANPALGAFLQDRGQQLLRTPVGDREVLEGMLASNARVGGEPSGHFLLLDHGLAGDALAASLVLSQGLIHEKGKKGKAWDQALAPFVNWPERSRNLRLTGTEIKKIDLKELAGVAEEAEERLGEGGRAIIRPSGTEPLLRFLVQGLDENRLIPTLDWIESRVKP